MKKFFLSAILGSNGRLVTWATGLAVSLFSVGLGKLGVHVTDADNAVIVATVTPGVAAALEGWASGINAAGVKSAQRELAVSTPGVVVDGVAGPVTVGAVVRGATAVKTLDSLAGA